MKLPLGSNAASCPAAVPSAGIPTFPFLSIRKTVEVPVSVVVPTRKRGFEELNCEFTDKYAPGEVLPTPKELLARLHRPTSISFCPMKFIAVADAASLISLKNPLLEEFATSKFALLVLGTRIYAPPDTPLLR